AFKRRFIRDPDRLVLQSRTEQRDIFGQLARPMRQYDRRDIEVHAGEYRGCSNGLATIAAAEHTDGTKCEVRCAELDDRVAGAMHEDGRREPWSRDGRAPGLLPFFAVENPHEVGAISAAKACPQS